MICDTRIRLVQPTLPSDRIDEKRRRGDRRRAGGKRGQVDYLGAGLMALALAGVTVGLGTGSESLDTSGATASPVNWPWLVVSAVALLGFVIYERLHPRPLVRLDLFKKPAFAAANVANFLVGVALIIGVAGISLYAQTLFGLSKLEAALLLVQLTLPMPIGAVLGGWLADLVGCKITAVVGFLAAGGGLLPGQPLAARPGVVDSDVGTSAERYGLRLCHRARGNQRDGSGRPEVDGDRLCLGHGVTDGWDGRRYVGHQFLGGAQGEFARRQLYRHHHQDPHDERVRLPERPLRSQAPGCVPPCVRRVLSHSSSRDSPGGHTGALLLQPQGARRKPSAFPAILTDTEGQRATMNGDQLDLGASFPQTMSADATPTPRSSDGKRPTVADLVPGTVIETVYLLSGKETRTTKAGKPYFKLRLSDRTGTVDCMVWEHRRHGRRGQER